MAVSPARSDLAPSGLSGVFKPMPAKDQSGENGPIERELTKGSSALAMADPGPHPPFFLPQLAAALARFLDSHAFLQVVTSPEYRARL
jgi:hypothetical protein